jgi:hypothetical protein
MYASTNIKETNMSFNIKYRNKLYFFSGLNTLSETKAFNVHLGRLLDGIKTYRLVNDFPMVLKGKDPKTMIEILQSAIESKKILLHELDKSEI